MFNENLKTGVVSYYLTKQGTAENSNNCVFLEVVIVLPSTLHFTALKWDGTGRSEVYPMRFRGQRDQNASTT